VSVVEVGKAGLDRVGVEDTVIVTVILSIKRIVQIHLKVLILFVSEASHVETDSTRRLKNGVVEGVSGFAG